MSDALIEAVAKAIADSDRTLTETTFLEPRYLRYARAALSAIEANGYRVVPVEPTQEMIEAGLEGEVVRDSSGTSWRSPTAYVYSAMLSAAPRIGGEK